MAMSIAYQNLVIIGTSHISKNSIHEVKRIISTLKPEIVALELDLDRFNSLVGKKKTSMIDAIKALGVINGLFVYAGSFLQSYLGGLVGVEPGSEMFTAVKEAKKVKAKLALIDQHIAKTIRKLNLRFRDIMILIWDSLNESIKKFVGLKTDTIEFDISKVPEDEMIDKLIKELKDKYPKFHKALIQDRNKVMTRNLIKIMEDNPEKQIVAVLGAGHKKEIIRGVKNHFEKKTS